MSKHKKTHSTKGLRPPKKHSTGHALKVYWPYIPLFLLLIGGMVINAYRPLAHYSGSTLAYATEISQGALLSSTNSQRAANGAAGLNLNSLLSQAAQNKATDMRNRNYWSHETPDGQQPWVFIDAVGYVYTKAGENLAYGYPTSAATVQGWMDSPSHRANMLDTTFTEVGFGFVNADNFNSSGNQTIVVAMYAKPYAAPTPAPAPEPEPVAVATTPQPQVQSSNNSAAPVTQPSEEVQIEEPIEETIVVEDTVIETAEPITTESTEEEIASAEPVRTTLITELTSGRYLWATTAISVFGFGLSLLWLMKHFVAVRKFIITGEHFVAHHPVFDLIVVGIISLAIYLTQGNGVVL